MCATCCHHGYWCSSGESAPQWIVGLMSLAGQLKETMTLDPLRICHSTVTCSNPATALVRELLEFFLQHQPGYTSGTGEEEGLTSFKQL